VFVLPPLIGFRMMCREFPMGAFGTTETEAEWPA
jgi:hypothetical protein